MHHRSNMWPIINHRHCHFIINLILRILNLCHRAPLLQHNGTFSCAGPARNTNFYIKLYLDDLAALLFQVLYHCKLCLIAQIRKFLLQKEIQDYFLILLHKLNQNCLNLYRLFLCNDSRHNRL